MAINVDTVKSEATNAVLDALMALYANADREAMEGFAEAIAEAAVVAVQNVIDHAQTEETGESIR